MGWKFAKTSNARRGEEELTPEARQAQGPVPGGVEAMPGAPAPAATAPPEHGDDDPAAGGGAPA